MGDRTYEGERSTFFVTGHPKARTAAQDDMLMFVGRRIGTYDLGRERLPAYEFVAMDEAQLSKPPEKANAWMWKKN